MPMTPRERFLATMTCRQPDRLPLYDFNFWDETIPEWHKQGLDRCWDRTNVHRHLGLDASLGGGHNTDFFHGGALIGLMPAFEPQVIEDLGDEEIIRDATGVLIRQHKHHVSIPPHVGHTLVDRASWEEHYVPRLDPNDPNRFHTQEATRGIKAYMNGPREQVSMVFAGSLFGWLRDWMGMENIALLPYDDPAWFEAMVKQLADVSTTVLEKTFNAGLEVDFVLMWEDMCYNSGPLLSPEFFHQYIVPQYKRVTSLCREAGATVIAVDCDGKIDALIPGWLEGGVNCMFPMEIGNWADPYRFREQYGEQLLMMGGFDKHILARSPAAIDAEIQRLTPLVEQGGFIPFCDHRVPPDVSYDNYRHYCNRVREVWGKGVDLPEQLETCETAGT